ncbi:MAG TPA: FAD-binding protein, partial [Opitutaceae bacterium]|nr:FAD-binding protein [Opitutaceae bacterium]
MASTSPATTQLKRRLGAAVRTDRRACWEASFDSSKLSFLPEAVVRPRRRADIGVVLTLANRHRVPVTVRGRGTSLTGAAVPLHGGWVIDLTGLRRVRIDAETGLAHVQAGATNAVVRAAAEAEGWFYPPD